MKKKSAIVATFLLCLTVVAIAQEKGPPKSPPADAECKFSDGKTVKVHYSSPRMRGRKIYGDLVPYGKVWRTGANEATSFVTDTDLTVGGKDVPAGSYTIFTVPAEAPGKWKLIVNKATGEWGVNKQEGYTYDATELARIDMNATTALDTPVEQFTISLPNKGGDTCTLRFDWEKTRAEVDVKEKK